jgi:hypothetical protein
MAGSDSGGMVVVLAAVSFHALQLLWLFVPYDTIHSTKLYTEWMTVKETAKAYFKALSQHSITEMQHLPGETEKNHETSTVKMAGLWPTKQTKHLSNKRQNYGTRNKK